MAKQGYKPDRDADEMPPLPAFVDTSPGDEPPKEQAAPQPEDPEKEELRRLLRQKTEEVEALSLKAAGINATPGVATYWTIELKYAPTHTVLATDAANAWDKYRKEMGVRSSQETPNVKPATHEEYHAAQAKRHGRQPNDFVLPVEQFAVTT